MNIGWPEGIWLGFIIFNIVIAAIMDGEPKKNAKHSFPITLVGSAISVGLLYWGGFFA